MHNLVSLKRPILLLTSSLLLILFFSSSSFSSGAFLHLANAEKARHKAGTKVWDVTSSHYKQWYFAGVAFPDAIAEISSKNPPKAKVKSWGHDTTFFNDAAKLISQNCSKLSSSAYGVSCKELTAFYLGALTHIREDYRFDNYFVTKVQKKCFNHSRDGDDHGDKLDTAQKWTDNKLDQVASCDEQAYYKKNIVGSDNRFNIKFPTGFIRAVANENDLTLTDTKIKEAYGKWLDNTVGKEMDILEYGFTCSVGAFYKPIKDKCEWGAKKENYWSDSKEKGSVADVSEDILPGWLSTTYDKLVNSMGKSHDYPTFSKKGKWPNNDFCREWIPKSAAYCN